MAKREAHAHGDTLYSGCELQKGELLRSGNGLFTLIMQDDGNFVSYNYVNGEPAPAIFHSNTWKRGQRTVLRDDGRLVVLDAVGQEAWASSAKPLQADKYRLVLQDDADAVIYNSHGVPVWSNFASSKVVTDPSRKLISN